MFTGIVEEIGYITRVARGEFGHELTIRAPAVLDGTAVGDSIAVNGTCLTVTSRTDEMFTTGCAPETLLRTNLGQLETGDPVNLERSLTPSTRMGGHFVQGHIDGVGEIMEILPDEESLRMTISFDQELMRYVVPKGFITVDGISLTVVDAFEKQFSIMLIAFTQTETTIGDRRVGDRLNIEVDILGKYVERILGGSEPREAQELIEQSEVS